MVRFNPSQKFQGVKNCPVFSNPGTYRNFVTYSFWYVFAIFAKSLTFVLNSQVVFSAEMNSVFFSPTCKQGNVYVPFIFAKYLNFALFAEFQPIATVDRSSTTHSIKKVDQNIVFFGKFYSSEWLFSLGLLATLMKTLSDSDNLLVPAPLPEPFLDTKTMWKPKTKEKQHNHRIFAFFKFFNDLSQLRSMFFSLEVSAFLRSN